MSKLLKYTLGGQDSKSVQTSMPTDQQASEFKGLRGQFSGALSALLQQGGGPEYSGPLVAGLKPPEQTALDATAASTYDPNRAGLLASTLKGNFLPGQPGANPFMDAAIRAAQRPTLEGLTETLSRALPGRFTQAGQFVNPRGSSAFDRSAAIATRGAANAVGDIATNISNEQYGQERNRQQQAIQLGQQDVQTMISNLQAQGLPRLIEDTGIERGIGLFNSRVNNLLDILKTVAGVTAPVIANEGKGESNANASTGLLPSLTKIVSPR